MDPAQCWKELCAAMKSGDMESVSDHAIALETWRHKGGFRPDCIPETIWHPNRLRNFVGVLTAILDANG